MLICIDTFRQDKVGAYGNKKGLTPHIDRLAADGILFENAVANAPWTLPSFASLYTSLYPSTHRAGEHSNLPPERGKKTRAPLGLSESALTLAEILKANGFKTACFHNNAFLSHRFNMNQGFNRIRQGHRGRSSIEHALDFAEDHRKHRQFILLHIMEPHAPYRAPEKFQKLFVVNQESDDPEERRLHVQSLYDAEIAYTDQMIGTFLGKLDDLGLLEKTLVVLTADHGEAFWEHEQMATAHYNVPPKEKKKNTGRGHGRILYQEVVAVPLILRYPGRLDAAARVGKRVSLIDVAPTVLDWLEIEIPRHFEGRSLRAGGLSPGQEDVGESVALAESFGPGSVPRHALYVGPSKLIFHPKTGFLELYDLTRDPGELENLAESDPDRTRTLLARLKKTLAQANALHDRLGLGDAPEPEISDETRRQLKALGYVDD